MHLSVVAILCTVQLAAAACAADNCLRAVIASAFPTRHGSADCSAYLVTTVTPSVSTVTATNTAFVTSTTSLPNIAARRASPTIPAYASACSGAVRYSSACSCIDITATTVTLIASTTSSTTTVTDVVSTVTDCANPLPTFQIQISAPGKPKDGTYIQANNNNGAAFVTSLSEASIFTLNSEGNIVTGNLETFIFTQFVDYTDVYFDSAAAIPGFVSTGLLTCSIAGGELLCSVGSNTFLDICYDILSIAVTPDTGCYTPIFNVLPLCVPPSI